MTRRSLSAVFACAALAGACVTPADELGGLADQAPLDCAVLVTGGAFLRPHRPGGGTFAAGGAAAGEPAGEAIPIESFGEVLARGNVFQHFAIDADAASRAAACAVSAAGPGSVADLRERARAAGFDYLLVIEELQDGPIEVQGTNARWPVTFVTWVLLGVGAFIPDRTFESRARLRFTLRELATGQPLHDQLLVAGPADLALTERTDVLGLLMSILVPPFWVGDDPEAVRIAVRTTTQRRLLLSLARDLKSELVRQRLRDLTAASFTLGAGDEALRLTVESAEGLTVARLRAEQPGAEAAAAAFATELLASVQPAGDRFRYTATLPRSLAGQRIQVLVGTLRGGIASATLRPGGGQ